MKTSAQINKAFRLGESLTDEELADHIGNLDKAIKAVEVLQHPPYSLMLLDLRLEHERAVSYQRARKER